jgi:hypothetical protein
MRAYLSQAPEELFVREISISYIVRDFCYFIWFTIAGYGLMRYKEWGRMLSLVAHVLFPVTSLLLGFSLFQYINVPYYDWAYNITLQIGYALPLLVWGYITIRALCHPVVKYVCLRGGHDIE